VHDDRDADQADDRTEDVGAVWLEVVEGDAPEQRRGDEDAAVGGDHATELRATAGTLRRRRTTASVLPEPDREHGQRRYGPDAVRRLEVLEVAKRAGFTLDEARVLLQRTDAGTPAFESLRELAARKLPDVEALITQAQEMRSWPLTATDCSCTTLDVCALFATDGETGHDDSSPAPLQITQVPRSTATV